MPMGQHVLSLQLHNNNSNNNYNKCLEKNGNETKQKQQNLAVERYRLLYTRSHCCPVCQLEIVIYIVIIVKTVEINNYLTIELVADVFMNEFN